MADLDSIGEAILARVLLQSEKNIAWARVFWAN